MWKAPVCSERRNEKRGRQSVGNSSGRRDQGAGANGTTGTRSEERRVENRCSECL